MRIFKHDFPSTKKGIKNKKMKSKEKKTTVRVMIIIAVLVALILIISLTNFSFSGSHQKNENFFSGINNCTCVQMNRLRCDYGFELNGSFCVNTTEQTFTNALLGCSLYNCSSVLYQFNNQTQLWDVKN